MTKKISMSYRYGINPKIPHPNDRPRCVTCEAKPKQIRGHYNDGSPRYRSECYKCYQKKLAKKHDVPDIRYVIAKNAGFNSVKEHVAYKAEVAGFDSVADWKNSKHAYRKYRKDYCQNVDGRLGFECTTTIIWKGMLEVDHKNGMPSDNRPRNLQTLCKCCHAYKTNVFKDYATPGRKKIKELKVKERMAA